MREFRACELGLILTSTAFTGRRWCSRYSVGLLISRRSFNPGTTELPSSSRPLNHQLLISCVRQKNHRSNIELNLALELNSRNRALFVSVEFRMCVVYTPHQLRPLPLPSSPPPKPAPQPPVRVTSHGLTVSLSRVPEFGTDSFIIFNLTLKRNERGS